MLRLRRRDSRWRQRRSAASDAGRRDRRCVCAAAPGSIHSGAKPADSRAADAASDSSDVAAGDTAGYSSREDASGIVAWTRCSVAAAPSNASLCCAAGQGDSSDAVARSRRGSAAVGSATGFSAC